MTDPIALALRVASILDSHDVPYALGGSLASTIFGEPRGTVDIDIAVRLEERHLAELLEVLEMEFYVPVEAARQAVELRTSFNIEDLIQTASLAGLGEMFAEALSEAQDGR